MRIPIEITRVLAAAGHNILNKGIDAAFREAVEANPAYWHEPVSSEVVADMLGVSAAALATARSRGRGPDCYATLPGIGVRYTSRAAVLAWVDTHVGLPEQADIRVAPPARRVVRRAST